MTPSIPNRAAPSAPTLTDPALMAQRTSQIQSAAAMYGRQATILTGGQGAQGAAPVQRKTLLGGG